MSAHTESYIRMAMPKAMKLLLDDQSEVLAIPGYDDYVAAMTHVQADYANRHNVPFWEVGVHIEPDVANGLITFVAYRKEDKPRGDNS